MSAITPDDIKAAYKELYIGQEISELVYDKKSRQLMSRLERNEDFEGDTYPVPVMYEDVGGGSCNFKIAQKNVAGMELATFHADVQDYHRVVQWKAKTLRKMKSQLGAFIKKAKVKQDSALNALANDIEKSLFRSAAGNLGTIGSETQRNTLQIHLASPADAKNFAINDVVIASHGLNLDPNAQPLKVVKVDRLGGTMTMSGAVDLATAGWAYDDYLFRQGDYMAAGDQKRIHGLADWIPTTLESGLFMRVDRSKHREALAGILADGSLSNVESSIKNAAIQAGELFGAAPDVCLTTFTIWGLLADELGIEVRRDDGGEVKAGFQSIYIVCPNGMVEVVPCTHCQADTAWLLDLSTWEIISAGPLVAVFDDDGQLITRVGDDDSLEVRCVSFPDLVCEKPGHNTRITFN